MVSISPEYAVHILEVRSKVGEKFNRDNIVPYLSEVGPAAAEYVRDYDGNFSFMVEMHKHAKNSMTLNRGQMAGVLNCMVAQINRDMAMKDEDPVFDLTAVPSNNSQTPQAEPTKVKRVPDGYYAVKGSGDMTVLIRLRKNKIEGAPEGSQIAAFNYAGRNSRGQFENFAFVNGQRHKVWRRFHGDENEVTAVKALMVLLESADPIEFGRAYAYATKRCYKCGMPLNDEVSVEFSIGPVCRDKMDPAELPARLRMKLLAERKKKARK